MSTAAEQGGEAAAPAAAAGRHAPSEGPAIGTEPVRRARRLLRLADAVLFSYSQVLFTQRRTVGLLLLAATLLKPRVGLAGLAAVLLSFLVVRVAQFSDELAGRGNYGYNPLLVGLAVGALFEPGGAAVALLVVAVVAVVFLQTALESALGYFFNLPVLSLPFVAVTFLIVAAAPLVGGLEASGGAESLLAFEQVAVPPFAALYLRSLGAVFFSPELLAGAIVFAALAVFSRIGVLLSLLGFAVGWAVVGALQLGSPHAPLVIGYNGILVAVALGGVWFVPQRSSFAFAGVAVLMTAFISVAAFVFLLPFNLPVLILPFNLAMFVGLYAMRQRARDGAPKAVEFPVGAPEANLNHYRTRVARFSTRLAARIALPFSGRWTVTQGVGGEHTHRGQWRDALDFEVLDRSGSNHAGPGTSPRDYYCYRLPVFAAADGTVLKVVRDVPDNAIGQRNPANNWGNLVLLQHGVGLYSLVCHLAPGTVEVAEGQFVRQGLRLGLCGNSGRSFVPHLHFHLQSSPRIGAPTRELELSDVVAESGEGAVLHRVHVPAKGESVRNLDAKEEVGALFSIPIGARLKYRSRDARGRAREETLTSRIDLLNNLYLESEELGGRLYFESQAKQFIVYDYEGPRESVLYLLWAAAPRVPYELGAGLAWDDVLSRRQFRPAGIGWLADALEPFLPVHGCRVALSSERDGAALVVRGRGSLGSRAIESRARFEAARGPVHLELNVGGRVRTAELLEVGYAA